MCSNFYYFFSLKEPSGFTSFLDENEEATGFDDAKIDYSANSHSPNLSDVYDRRTGCWSEKMYVPTEESKNEEEEVIERSWIGLSEREKVSEMASLLALIALLLAVAPANECF